MDMGHIFLHWPKRYELIKLMLPCSQVLVMVPCQETFKFLSSSSGRTYEGDRCQFEQFDQHDTSLGLFKWYTAICLLHAKPSYIESFNTLSKKMLVIEEPYAWRYCMVMPPPTEYLKMQGNLLMAAIKVALLRKQHDTLEWIFRHMKDDVSVELFTWIGENIDPPEVPWLKLKQRSVYSHIL